MKFNELSIKTQILMSFALISVISLLLIAGLSIGNIVTLGQSINTEASDSLQDQIISNMNSTSAENANVIQEKFRNAQASVSRIVKATSEIFSGTYNFTGSTVSYADNQTDIDLRDAVFDASYGENISSSTSTYYYPATALVGGQLTSAMNNTIRLSSYLDSILASIWAENREYAWLYISFSDGIFRNFPGANVDADRLYEPVKEAWHIEAVNARGGITFSPPYFDLTQGLVVSLTQAVYVNNIPIAVVGLDFKTTTIQEKVLDVNFLENGYAALYQADDLTVIAHQEWDSAKHNEDDPIPLITDLEVNSDGSTAYDDSILFQLKTDESGVIDLIKGGDTYFLAHAPIYGSGDDIQYVLTITVLASEVLAPVKGINDDIVSSQTKVTSTAVLLSLLTIAGSLVVGLWLSNSITKPIMKLTKLAKSITKNVTKADIFEGIDLSQEDLQADDEIGDLTRSFSGMVQSLRDEQSKKKAR